MERRSFVLSLLFLTILVSGCSSISGGGDESGFIEVHRLEVQPQKVFSDSNVRASIDVFNTGNQEAEISLGENGQKVLKDHCPDIFEIDEFSVSTTGERNGNTVTLGKDRNMKLRWTLAHGGNAPIYGISCRLKFELPFDYSVDAYKQVQIKESREVEGSELQHESSSGPMVLAIETIGSTSREGQSTFIAGEDDKMTVLFQLQNHGNQDVTKGVIDVDEESLSVSADESPISLSLDDCNLDEEDEIRMFEGESRIISCDVEVPSSVNSPSVITEISASVDYTYLKEAGTRKVEVKPRGN